jgi:hypothetical protein
MTARTQAMYQLCLQRLLDIWVERTGARPQPLRMVADYELVLLQAMQTIFPNGHARGCWYQSSMVCILVYSILNVYRFAFGNKFFLVGYV